MTWDRKKGKYYRSRRRGKKVVREYYGNGEKARLAAGLDDVRRRQREAMRVTLQSLDDHWRRGSDPVERLFDGIDLLLRVIAVARIPAHSEIPMENLDVDTVMLRMREMLARIDAGDETALIELRSLMQAEPQIVEHFGNLANIARQVWEMEMSRQNPAIGEAVRQKVETLRTELGAPSATPLETLMIDQVIVNWLQSHYAEAMVAQAMDSATPDPIRRRWHRYQDECQQRFARSLQHLARLRGLLGVRATNPIRLHGYS